MVACSHYFISWVERLDSWAIEKAEERRRHHRHEQNRYRNHTRVHGSESIGNDLSAHQSRYERLDSENFTELIQARVLEAVGRMCMSGIVRLAAFFAHP